MTSNMLFTDLTEQEAITLFTMLEHGNRAAYRITWPNDYRPYIELTAEAAALQGQLAAEMTYGPAHSEYLMRLVMDNNPAW